MARMPRKESGTGIYHVMLRGTDRRIIFSDDEDCERFLETMRRTKRDALFQLFAYCLMGNHVHLLLKEGEEPLGVTFKRIGVSYVHYYNWKTRGRFLRLTENARKTMLIPKRRMIARPECRGKVRHGDLASNAARRGPEDPVLGR